MCSLHRGRASRMHGFLEKVRDLSLVTPWAHGLTRKVRMAVTFLKGQEWGLNQERSFECSAQCLRYRKCSKNTNYSHSKGCVISSGFQNVFLWIWVVKHFPTKEMLYRGEEGRPGWCGGGQGPEPTLLRLLPPLRPLPGEAPPCALQTWADPAGPLGGPQRPCFGQSPPSGLSIWSWAWFLTDQFTEQPVCWVGLIKVRAQNVILPNAKSSMTNFWVSPIIKNLLQF